jgi:hypothetical protein
MVDIASLPEDLQRMVWSHYIVGLRMRSFRRTLLKPLEQAYQTRYKRVPLYEGRLCPLAVAYTYDGRAGYTKRMGRLIQVHRFITSWWQQTNGGWMYWGDTDFHYIVEGHTFEEVFQVLQV